MISYSDFKKIHDFCLEFDLQVEEVYDHFYVGPSHYSNLVELYNEYDIECDPCDFTSTMEEIIRFDNIEEVLCYLYGLAAGRLRS